MSNDLISRKALEKAIRDYADDVGCNRGEIELANGILKVLSIVEIAPTAYDVDKVVEQLKSHNNSEKMATSKIFDGKHRYYRAVSVTKAIKIVRAGGIEHGI